VFDTVTAAAEECSTMSCAKSRKRFSGGWLLVDSLHIAQNYSDRFDDIWPKY